MLLSPDRDGREGRLVRSQPARSRGHTEAHSESTFTCHGRPEAFLGPTLGTDPAPPSERGHAEDRLWVVEI